MSKTDRALEALLSRASCDDLVDPAPDGAMLETILSAGLRAPDHGKLRPWRYVVIEGEHRAAFADLVLKGMRARDPDVPQKKLEKRRKRFGETPMTIALGMHLRPDNKIPLAEQEAAVSAGVMNVLNALHLAGFGGLWVTGDVADDPGVCEALGFAPPHRLAGFLFVGTPEETPRSKRADIEDYMAVWKGKPVRFGADKD
nr:nitroreductase [Tanticharoenia sakaeratensis]